MTHDKRLLLLFALLTVYILVLAESRYHSHEEPEEINTRHKHRHRHESSIARRDHRELTDRRPSWPPNYDYEDDKYYGTVPNYDKSYPRTQRNNYRARMFEQRYPSRYHHRNHRGNDWYDDEYERHRTPTRYDSWNHRSRPSRRRKLSYSRNRDESDFSEPEDEEELDYDESRKYDDEDKRYSSSSSPWWRNSRRHRSWRRDWKQRGYDHHERRYHNEDLEKDRAVGSRKSKIDDWRKRSNSTVDSKFPRNEKRREEEEEEEIYDYEDHLEESSRNRDEEEEEDDWKDIEDDDDDKELDNDFYKDNDFYNTDEKPPLKTYDDIIKRLTSDDPTTSRSTVKREYRNTEIDKHAKSNPYGNSRYQPKNVTRTFARIVREPYVGATSSYVGNAKAQSSTAKSTTSSSTIDRKASKSSVSVVVKGNDRLEKKTTPKIDNGQPKTKSLEQDYDEYLNAGDNEKEEDLIKAGVDDESSMQADVTNTDYSEDEVLDEAETPADVATTSTTSTTTTSTSTTTTTTTPKPVANERFDYRDSRAYDGGTGSQYNGYQSKNDYPPMSPHSVHKWQSLGTRESVKETRSNMQQYNKNGKTAEIKEAIQHAIKVSREGSCQWPRARVVPVREVYPSPSTTYIPHCAILHRCSDDTGCCRSEALTCVPKHSHRVELTFYTTNVGGASVVEKLSFYNHTECECRERSEYEQTSEKPVEQRFYRHFPPAQPPQNIRRPPRKPCRCPSEFTPRITAEGECQCNCYENDQNCIKTRRGKGYFSVADRICIQNEECAMPSCEFGEYMKRHGRCPRKRDKFDEIVNYRTSLNHRYRS